MRILEIDAAEVCAESKSPAAMTLKKLDSVGSSYPCSCTKTQKVLPLP